jgi:cell division protease FtsH
MCSALGGRAAEELMFGKISTGALSDLEKVTKQAYAMVSIYGLNKRLGNVSYYDSQGRDMFTKPYSDDTAKIIDEEVSELIESQYQRALEILNNHKEKLIQLADKLLTEEVIFKENLEEIFGKRPWDPKEEADTTDAISSIETPQEPTTEQNENPEPDTDPT